MTTNYERGRKIEWRARKDLTKMGYVAVRSAGSKTPIDIVAIGPDQVILIQVKSERENLEQAVAKLRAVQCPPNCIRQVWHWINYQGWQVTTVKRMPTEGMEALVYGFHPSPSHSELQQGEGEQEVTEAAQD